MNEYVAPQRDQQFLLERLGHLCNVTSLPGNEEVSTELFHAVLDEAAKFATEMLSPLNVVGDREGCRFDDGSVRTATGWKAAYEAFCQGGWTTLELPTEYGGQALPKLLSTVVEEVWGSANLAFAILPLLTKGAIQALLVAGSDELRQKYVPNMVSGAWTGTMNLTEPQAGSDLAAIRTRAEPQRDGTYKLFGQKIFISYGDHDIAGNVVHLVLARLPDAPLGIKGISLFVCPKFIVDSDGKPGVRNDVHCVSIEHKMGIHASPTCVMSYGDHGGAIAELVGEANRGLEYMFVMMNEARFGVGVQGLSVAERAYQLALTYAKERVQGRDAITGKNNVEIIHHPDIKRLLLRMRALIVAVRALIYHVATLFDVVHRSSDREVAEREQRAIDVLIPVVKSWSTEIANKVAYLGVQVHGGMGFIEETGAAQFMRDSRILPIYEGTNGIQAIDLLGRKLLRDQGAGLAELIGRMRSDAAALAGNDQLHCFATEFGLQLVHLEECTQWVLSASKERTADMFASATPYLELLGTVCGSWQMVRVVQGASQRQVGSGDDNTAYTSSLIALARIYFAHVAVDVPAQARRITGGGRVVTDFDVAQL